MSEPQSKAEFEEYLAQVQSNSASPQSAQPSFRRSAFGRIWHWTGILGALAIFALCFSYVGKKHDADESKQFWDWFLGTAADWTGREYNPDAETLTEQLTLRPRNR